MPPDPLDYQPRPQQDHSPKGALISVMNAAHRWRRWVSLTVVAVTIVIVASPLLSAKVRQDLGWIDSISGSQKTQTVWRSGSASTPVVAESLLAARYRKLGLQWEPDWKNTKGTYFDITGHNVGRAHGSAPEIYTLALHADLQRRFLAASSDDEVREFFRVMSSGTEAEQRAAVEAACDKALGAAVRPGG